MVGEEDIPLYPPFTKEEEARPGLTAIASAASWKSQPPETSQSLALSDVPQPHPASYVMPQGLSRL